VKSKNLIILCVWSGLTIIFVLLIVLGASYSDNPAQWLIWMFEDWWVVFLVTLVFTGAVVFFKKEPEIELQSELQSMVSKLDELTRDIEVIKKAIEE
jgi:ABC-type transport system involved in multi-copper enzyme maturation permease subunit